MAHPRAEEYPFRPLHRPRSLRVHHIRGLNPIPEKPNPAVDLPQAGAHRELQPLGSELRLVDASALKELAHRTFRGKASGQAMWGATQTVIRVASIVPFTSIGVADPSRFHTLKSKVPVYVFPLGATVTTSSTVK